MEGHLIFVLCVILIFGGYQVYWIWVARKERDKWKEILLSGRKYKAKITAIQNTYMRFGDSFSIIVSVDLPNRGEALLTNWPSMKYCPYTIGTETEVYWSKKYPEEFMFIDESLWVFRGLNPVHNGKIKQGIFQIRFFLTWAFAIVVIIIGLQL